MELEGYEVLTSYDGFEAIEQMKQHRPDLVLMDVNLPEMNGVDTYSKMEQIIPGIPAVMMTAYPVEEVAGGSLREKHFCILKKPLKFSHLFNIIRRISSGTSFKGHDMV